MPIRADNDPRFSRRFLIMGVVAIGFAFWSLYDGMVKYPAQRVRGFDEFKVGYKSEFEDPNVKELTVDQFEQTADKNHEWAKYVHERGIKSIPEIFTQYVQAAVAGLVGLFLLSIPLRSRPLDRSQRIRHHFQLGTVVPIRPGRAAQQAKMARQRHCQSHLRRRRPQAIVRDR